MRARFINIKFCTAQQIAELKRQYCDDNNSSFSDMHINQIMDVLNYQNTYRSTTIDAASMHLFVFFLFILFAWKCVFEQMAMTEFQKLNALRKKCTLTIHETHASLYRRVATITYDFISLAMWLARCMKIWIQKKCSISNLIWNFSTQRNIQHKRYLRQSHRIYQQL